MPGTLPFVRNGSVALYPLPRTTLIATTVQKFLNASEQRFQKHAPLAQFELAYTNLFAADRDALKAFVADTKGAFDDTWSFTVTALYPLCTFLDDAFTSTESSPNLYDVTLRFRQTQPNGYVVGTTGAFPTLSTGATSQRPFSQIVRYRTTINDSPSGMRYSYAFYNAGLTGFPTRGLMAWKLEFPSISDADMATLEGFFVGMQGKYQTFSFTDPDSLTTYTKVRFDQDSFVYTYLDFNHASTTILLAETN